MCVSFEIPSPFFTPIRGCLLQDMPVSELWGHKNPAFQSRGMKLSTRNAPALPSTVEEHAWFHWAGQANLDGDSPPELQQSRIGDQIALLSLDTALEEIIWPTAASLEVIWRILSSTQACVDHAGQLPHKASIGWLLQPTEIKLLALSVGSVLHHKNAPYSSLENSSTSQVHSKILTGFCQHRALPSLPVFLTNILIQTSPVGLTIR